MNARLDALRRWSETRAAHRIGTVLRWTFFAGVVAWLFLKMRAIGWAEVIASLPTTPWFYLIFAAMFLALPFSETLIFRLILHKVRLKDMGVFVRKRVFNSAFVGYSGELYLFVWARRTLGIPARAAAHGIKDNAVLSALASALLTAVLLALFWATGQAGTIASWLDSGLGKLLTVALVTAFVLPVALRFRRSIIAVPARIAGAVFGIHVLRIGGVMLLQALQWWVVLPDQSWTTWLLFLTAQMVISRLPFIPNRDLLFLGAGIEMSNAIDGPRAAMAGVLLAGGALTQATNLLCFVLTSFGRSALKPEPAAPEDLEALSRAGEPVADRNGVA